MHGHAACQASTLQILIVSFTERAEFGIRGEGLIGVWFDLAGPCLGRRQPFKIAEAEGSGSCYFSSSITPVHSQGKYVTSKTTLAIIKRKGKACRETLVSGLSKRKEPRKRFMPTGGVR